ncbi:MAG: tetratricopeptide repeat protein, partial [Pirellulales bacterium]
MLRELRQPILAERHYREALRLEPRLQAGYLGLGSLLDDFHQYDDAVDCLTKAVEIDPNSATAFSMLARSRLQQGRLDDAVIAASKAIELDATRATAHCNLASCFRALGRLDEAIDAYRAAIRLDPNDPFHFSNLVYTLIHLPGTSAAAIFAEHRSWGRLLADPWSERALPHTNDRSDRRLRVGYVSAHFCDHAVNFFSEPLLAAHDHAAVEVFCYSNGSQADQTNARLKAYADGWREIGHLSDEQAGQQVRDDRIDILVDLSGHIAGHRLLLFARKPAPVQVTYLGYQATTGMRAMDYRLTDAWSDPPGTTDADYTEKLVRLPQAFFCYRPSPDAPPVEPLPAVANGYVTFGSFNNIAKVTPQVLAAWAQLLREV